MVLESKMLKILIVRKWFFYILRKKIVMFFKGVMSSNPTLERIVFRHDFFMLENEVHVRVNWRWKYCASTEHIAHIEINSEQ